MAVAIDVIARIMARTALINMTRQSCRALRSCQFSTVRIKRLSVVSALARASSMTVAPFSNTRRSTHSIVPDGQAPDSNPVKKAQPVISPAKVTDEEFHQVADEYLEKLLSHMEEYAEKHEEVDVEYASGVITVKFAPDIGTYVINKQPPNKQIWLSSPKSGPKRYDLVLMGDGMDEKQDTARSEWVYLRDNTTMNELFVEELGIDLRMPAGSYGE